ncbi:ABC transporter permease [Paenibacillus contaminans]|uniref:Sugar ABC transporter permease n=1 Tax=Paenibacillus contaminans TaxID=450362 RepID=A0A329LPN8_9BACL|nr:ABC transporter permease subunit [Paenibacillus contaminans]RAV09911.1 sugar ABC transporter permease [Paenibacillus contaminans]
MNNPTAIGPQTAYGSVARRSARKVWNQYKYYYLLILPGVLYFLIFHYGPMLGIMIAFKDFKIIKGILGSDWAGLKWFEMLFTQDGFWLALRNTFYISFYKLIFGFPVPIILAIMLNELAHVKLKKLIQTIVYFPHFLSWVVLGGIMIAILSPSTGIVSIFGVSKSPLMDPGQFRGLLVLSEIWKEAGWSSIIYLAAIAGINPEMYEAAKIDGATRLQAIRFITLPSISSTIIILLILKTGHILSAGFDQVYILYNPITYEVGDILDTYVYRIGLSMGKYSLAAAAGLFKSAVGLVMLLFTNWLAKRLGGQGLW